MRAIAHCLAVLAVTISWPAVLAAQSIDTSSNEVRLGDRWVYETKDEITGYPQATYTEIVTQISPAEIIVDLTISGKDGTALFVFDHDWNEVDTLVWKYKPNDGQGIRLPLAVGKEWRSEFDAKNTVTSANMRASVLSKVVAQQTLTTPAGTFETYKIERRIREFDTANPSRLSEIRSVIWYAPQINHWVRRTFETMIQKRTRASTSEELTEFTREF